MFSNIQAGESEPSLSGSGYFADFVTIIDSPNLLNYPQTVLCYQERVSLAENDKLMENSTLPPEVAVRILTDRKLLLRTGKIREIML
jgi:hypothetical protein